MLVGFPSLSARSDSERRNSLHTPSLSPVDEFDSEVPDFVVDEIADSHCAVETQDSQASSDVYVRNALLDSPGLTLQRSRDELETARHQLAVALAEKLELVGKSETARKLRECHQSKSFAVCHNCAGVSVFYNRCDIFWCPLCSPRIASRRLEDLMHWVALMKQPKHIVLTLRNVETLTKSYLQSAAKSLARFRRRKLFSGARSGFWCMEITQKGKGFHVHFHLVVDVPWIPVRDLSDVWKQCNDSESSVVWIESANKGGLRKNLPRYVTKYTGKGFSLHEWSAEHVGQFHDAVQGVRTFGVFGEFVKLRAAWTRAKKENRKLKRVCACGCSKFSYYSEMEWQWKCNFTGWRSHTESPQAPPRRETQFRWHFAIAR